MTIWVIQIFLTLVFAAAGTMKLVRSQAQLAATPHMAWAAAVPEAHIRLLGLAEWLGAVGLVAPTLTGIAPFLTRVAAVCLASLMGGAVATHLMRREPMAASMVVAVLTMAVAALG